MAFVLRAVVLIGIFLGALFGAAGRLDLPFFWAYVALFLAFVVLVGTRLDRDLLAERIRPKPGGKDRRLPVVGQALGLAQLVIAGLDVGRFHWSPPIPLPVQLVALALCAASLGLSSWAMFTNRFFSPVVRIQSERGHHLVSNGPYRFVRHPGYLGALIGCAAGPVALGSSWALLPMVAAGLLVLRRTALEDRFLREGLAGYPEYVQRVRFRLLPGIW